MGISEKIGRPDLRSRAGLGSNGGSRRSSSRKWAVFGPHGSMPPLSLDMAHLDNRSRHVRQIFRPVPAYC